MTGPGPPRTVSEFLENTRWRFEESGLAYGHGTKNARDEAARLILHVLRLPPVDLRPYFSRRILPAEQRRLRAIVERRVQDRVPAPYLMREVWLGGLRFYIDRRAIVPRSFIGELLRGGCRLPLPRSPRAVLDLCTGSGCLAVLVARACPSARVDACDLSLPALSVARRNIADHGLRDRVRLERSDLFSALEGRTYDMIVCNPPYVDSATMARLPAEHRHEPRMALAGGPDGLALVRRVVVGAKEHLNARGILVCETGPNRGAVERAFPGLSFEWPKAGMLEGDYVFTLRRNDLP